MHAVNADAGRVPARQGVDEQKRGACPYGRCTTRSVTSQNPGGHVKASHGKMGSSANADARLVPAGQAAHEQKPHGCPQVGCESRFFTRHGRRLHMMTHGDMGSPVKAQVDARLNMPHLANDVNDPRPGSLDQRDLQKLEKGTDQS
ncbi:MAG: hypothetical protein OXC07_00795 [Kistimonas sp.]|nr:hypothetical protein [Kistimonas sp.]